MLNMFLKRMRTFRYVIQVNINELIYHISQHIVGECLKNREGVRNAKRKNTIFKVAPEGIKGSFPFILLSYANQMMSVAVIQFREKWRPLQTLKNRRHQRQRISILHHDVVQPPIVNTVTKRAFLLFHKKETRTSWRRRGADDLGC